MFRKLGLSLAAAASLVAADFTVVQKVSETAVAEIRGTDTTGYQEGDFGTVAVEADDEKYNVVALNNALSAGLPSIVNIDSLEAGEEVTVGIFVDGQRTSWRKQGNGVAFEGLVERDLVVLVLREDGSSLVRRYEVGDVPREAKGERASTTTVPLALRFLVRRPGTSQYCEVVPGSGLGGRFVSAPARTFLNYRTTCKTDRVARTEEIVTILVGLGTAESGIRTPLGTFGGLRALPFAEVRQVGADPRLDNLTAFLRIGTSEARLLVPIGSR